MSLEPVGGQPGLAFQGVDARTPGKNALHLDLHADDRVQVDRIVRRAWPSSAVPMQSHFELVVQDLNAAGTAMVELGATVAVQPEPADPHLTVVLDPAGHPFCLIRSATATRF